MRAGRAVRADHGEQNVDGISVDRVERNAAWADEKGGELAAHAARRDPPLPVLLVSGYTRDELTHGEGVPPGVVLLGKPYRRDDLARTVRSVLDQHRKAAAPQNTTQTATPATTPGTNAASLLLVEDDALSREAMHAMLTAFGLRCTAAANAEDALALTGTQRFDVLLTDLTLPGQSGAELARTLLRAQPHLQVLLMSGYGAQAEIGEPIAGAHLLGKPIALPALQQALAPWLHASPPGVTRAA